ncbi:MAG: CRISPR system precrRNA processing endoribonuclease RAMP protein Cas6 [Chloroflexota bacterium]
MGRAVQHVLLRQVVEPHDPTLSQALHDSSGLKPYTVTGLMRPDAVQPLYGDVRAGDRAWIRMVGLRRDVTVALREWAFFAPDLIEIDGVPWHVEAVYHTQRSHFAAGGTSYRRMVAQAQQPTPAPKISMAFPSPTAFHSGGVNLPFPLPSLVFGSMARQWAAFNGPTLPTELDPFIEHYVMLHRYNLETAIFSFKQGSKQIGFTGTTVYEIASRNRRLERVQPELSATLQQDHRRLAQMVPLLVDVSFYSGIGVKTTSGMGFVSRPGRIEHAFSG